MSLVPIEIGPEGDLPEAVEVFLRTAGVIGDDASKAVITEFARNGWLQFATVDGQINFKLTEQGAREWRRRQ